MRYRVKASTLSQQIKVDTAGDALTIAQALFRDGAKHVMIRTPEGAWFTIEEMERVIASIGFRDT